MSACADPTPPLPASGEGATVPSLPGVRSGFPPSTGGLRGETCLRRSGGRQAPRREFNRHPVLRRSKPMERSVFVPAYAKVNLTLAVLGKRADGYHDLASVMQTISLHDTLRLTPNRSGWITARTDSPELNTADNLALRAALALRDAVGDDTLGVEIELRKAIPSPGGLGGGSSDAA